MTPPGLIRGVARTAVVAGTATAVSNNVSRRQAERWQRNADQQAAAGAPQAPTASGPTADTIERLKQLAELKKDGVLTEEEFAAQKAALLGT